MAEKEFVECEAAPLQGMGPGEIDFSSDCTAYGEVAIQPTEKHIEECRKLGIDKEEMLHRGLSKMRACSRHAGNLVDPEDDELKGLWEQVK